MRRRDPVDPESLAAPRLKVYSRGPSHYFFFSLLKGENMNAQVVKSTFEGAKLVIQEKSPYILVGVGITTLVSSGVMGIVRTPLAIEQLEKQAMDKYSEYRDIATENDCEIEPLGNFIGQTDILKNPVGYIQYLGPKDTFLAVWKAYAPSAILAGLGIGCIIAGTKEMSARNLALAGAASFAEKTLATYQEKVTDILTDEQSAKVRQEIAKEVVEANPVEETKLVVGTPEDVLFFDSITGQAFKSTENKVMAAVNQFNHDLIGGYMGSLNDWYYILGLKSTPIGASLGWSAARLLHITIEAIKTEDGKPALVIVYDSLPTSSFDYH